MTKTAGILYILLAAVVLAISIGNFAGQFGAAAEIAGSGFDDSLSTTDLRWSMGVQFLVDLLVVAVIAIVGWFLHGSETEQYAYVIATGVLLIGSLTIRLMPLVPISAARLSPTIFFYGAQVQMTFTDDDKSYYQTLPQGDRFRVGRLEGGLPEKQGEVLLDFRGDEALMEKYFSAPWPVKVRGSVSGTRTLVRAKERVIFLAPRVKVFKVGED